MKKLLILPMFFGLVACDRPKADLVVRCQMQEPDNIMLSQHDEWGQVVYRKIRLQVYDDYAMASVDGGEKFKMRLDQVTEPNAYCLQVERDFVGIIPENGEELSLRVVDSKCDVDDIRVWMKYALDTHISCEFGPNVNAGAYPISDKENCLVSVRGVLGTGYRTGGLELLIRKEFVEYDSHGNETSHTDTVGVPIPDEVAQELVAPDDREWIFKSKRTEFNRAIAENIDPCVVWDRLQKYIKDNDIKFFSRVDMRGEK